MQLGIRKPANERDTAALHAPLSDGHFVIRNLSGGKYSTWDAETPDFCSHRCGRKPMPVGHVFLPLFRQMRPGHAAMPHKSPDTSPQLTMTPLLKSCPER